jgi:serine protease Do
MNLRGEEGRYYRGMIQTDAAINAGNSGGALVNSLGELIGINTLIYTPNQGNIGLGFAIPINRVKNIVTELKSRGKIERRVWVGWDLNTVDGRIARYLGLPKAEGVIVSNITRNSPATRGGLEIGDVILAINGETVSGEDAVWAILTDAKAGDVLHLRVYRESKTINLDIKLESRRS